jgi:hypothetical protein
MGCCGNLGNPTLSYPSSLGMHHCPLVPRPKSIMDYRWDEEKDLLVDIEGNPIEENSELLTYMPIGIVRTWSNASWSQNLTSRDDEEVKNVTPCKQNNFILLLNHEI